MLAVYKDFLYLTPIWIVSHVFASILLCKSPCDISETKPFLTYVSGLRFLACTGIVMKHFLNLHPDLDTFGGRLLANFHFALGASAVTFFVILSGLVTHYSYRDKIGKEPVRIFYLRRLGRVLATYYVTLTLAVVRNSVSQYRGALQDNFQMGNIICSYLLIGTWANRFGPNDVLWTIQSLVWCWIAYPGVARLLERLKRKYGAVIVSRRLFSFGIPTCYVLMNVLSLAGGADADGSWYWRWHIFPLCIFMDFSIGIIVGETLLSAKPQQHWAWGLCTDSTFVMWIILMLFEFANPFSNFGFIGLLGFLLLASACSSSSLLVRLCNHPLLVKLGEYSFHIYALQWPTFYELYPYIGEGVLPVNWAEELCFSWTNWLAGFFILIVLAVLLSDLFEQPYANWLRTIAERLARHLNAARETQQTSDYAISASRDLHDAHIQMSDGFLTGERSASSVLSGIMWNGPLSQEGLVSQER